MDRRDRDHYERNDYGTNYSGYKDYDRNDEHYHSARNLTDQFEREYQRERGFGNDDRYRRNHTYHEGNMGDFYERRRREVSSYRDYADNNRNERGRNRNDFGDFNRDRDRYSNYRDNSNDYRRNDYRDDQNMNRRDREQRGNRREGYVRSYDENTFGSRDTSRHEYNRGAGYGQNNNTGFANSNRGSRYSDRDYIGGPGTRAEDDRSVPGRRSYLQNRYY